jgi:hypothetical protein
MTQKQRLLNHLETFGKINPLDAWTKLGIYRLSDTIFRLRKEGYDIETLDLAVQNQFGEKCVVAEYFYHVV